MSSRKNDSANILDNQLSLLGFLCSNFTRSQDVASAGSLVFFQHPYGTGTRGREKWGVVSHTISRPYAVAPFRNVSGTSTVFPDTKLPDSNCFN